jgi:hypothetical protein
MTSFIEARANLKIPEDVIDAIDLLSRVFGCGPPCADAVAELEATLSSDACPSLLLGIAGSIVWKRLLKVSKETAIDTVQAGKLAHKDSEAHILSFLNDLATDFSGTASGRTDAFRDAVKNYCTTLDNTDADSPTFMNFVKVSHYSYTCPCLGKWLSVCLHELLINHLSRRHWDATSSIMAPEVVASLSAVQTQLLSMNYDRSTQLAKGDLSQAFATYEQLSEVSMARSRVRLRHFGH